MLEPMSNAISLGGIIVPHNNKFLEFLRELEVAATRHQALKEILGYVLPGTYVKFTWEKDSKLITRDIEVAINKEVRLTW